MMATPSSAPGATAPLLLLHLDINKTILMDDPAGGLSTSDATRQSAYV